MTEIRKRWSLGVERGWMGTWRTQRAGMFCTLTGLVTAAHLTSGHFTTCKFYTYKKEGWEDSLKVFISPSPPKEWDVIYILLAPPEGDCT